MGSRTLAGLIGRPGSGKTTVGRGVESSSDVRLLRVGDLLREEAEGDTAQARALAERMREGGLASTELVRGIVARHAADVAEPIVVLDGYPRARDQAESIEKLATEVGRTFSALVVLALPRSAAERRLTGRRVCSGCGRIYNIHSDPPPPDACADCGGQLERREDDRPEVVRQRQEDYDRRTRPVIQWVRDRQPGRLRCVRANGSPGTVERRLRNAILAAHVQTAGMNDLKHTQTTER